MLSVVSAARPKIADYPFTTLEPQLGVVRTGDDESFVMVDVPGLIAGAHEGAGFGDQFLRHVERTRVLLHLLDGAKPLEEIVADKAMIEAELAAWNPALLDEADAAGAQQARPAERARKPHPAAASTFPTFSASAPRPMRACAKSCWRCREPSSRRRCREIVEPPAAHIELAPADAFLIERRSDGAFVVSGERVERLAAMTNFDSDEALARFEYALGKMGVEKKLRELGAREGDTVHIGPYEFTYS